ncbi:hypothetical protein M3Y99_01904100 [Aphelenchoides fujianensis]|nr:hypothetical protein M3Y99_01904100 [Aphelenchoides fujianensis]
MQITLASAFSFFLVLWTMLAVGRACQPDMPVARQMELLRERLRMALVIAPPYELRNLTDAQLRTPSSNSSALRPINDKVPYDVDPELWRVAQQYANQLRYHNP